MTKEETTQTKEQPEQVEVPAKFQQLVEAVAKMSVLELSELVKVLEKKFGVSATPVAVAAAPGTGAAAAEAAPAKSTFNVELTDAGSQKIAVIKAVREITQKGLAEAKAMVEKPPVVLKENVKKEEAEELKKKLEAAGAKVELK